MSFLKKGFTGLYLQLREKNIGKYHMPNDSSRDSIPRRVEPPEASHPIK